MPTTLLAVSHHEDALSLKGVPEAPVCLIVTGFTSHAVDVGDPIHGRKSSSQSLQKLTKFQFMIMDLPSAHQDMDDCTCASSRTHL